MNIDLQRFCTIDTHSFFDLSRPWSDLEYTYASDSCILIRVPRIDGIAGQPKNDTLLAGQINDVLALKKMPKTWLAVEITGKEVLCSGCGGTGKVHTCPECFGEGEVVLQGEYREYETECEGCYGDGYLPEGKFVERFSRVKKEADKSCPDCSGAGKVFIGKNNRRSVAFEGVYFKTSLLAKLRDLPGIEIGLFEKHGLEPTPLRFIGGDGLIMPYQEY